VFGVKVPELDLTVGNLEPDKQIIKTVAIKDSQPSNREIDGFSKAEVIES